MDFWKLKSTVYDQGRRLPLIRKILFSEVQNLRSLLRSVAVPSDCSLDIGSGAGSTLDILPESKFRICMDRSKGMVDRLKKIHRAVARADALAIPFRDRSFSFISAVGLTEYVGQKGRLAEEIKRVILPGGMFLSTISPPGILNGLRNAMGNRIYPISGEDWESLLVSMGFSLVGKRKSLIQIQYAFKA